MLFGKASHQTEQKTGHDTSHTGHHSEQLYLMLLMSLQERLCPGHVLGQLVSGHDGLHVVNPGDQVAEVGQEAVQEVRLVQRLLTSLWGDERLLVFCNAQHRR